MILSRRIALGERQLDELHDAIVIRSINPGVPNETLNATDRMGPGQRLTAEHWNTLDVTVNYAIDLPKREMAARREIFDLVNSWALKKGWLTVNFIPDRQMRVDKVIVPGGGDPWEWTNEYTITFRAYNVPFWQGIKGESATRNITNGSINIHVPGQVRTVLNAALQNISGQTISDISIGCGIYTLNFKGINLGGNATLNINHGTDGLLRAYIGNTSVYGRITGADDLWADPGDAVVTINSKRSVRATIEAVGRYV